MPLQIGVRTQSLSRNEIAILFLYRFTGPNCEININECDMNNCQNDATCVDRYVFPFDITIFRT